LDGIAERHDQQHLSVAVGNLELPVETQSLSIQHRAADEFPRRCERRESRSLQIWKVFAIRIGREARTGARVEEVTRQGIFPGKTPENDLRPWYSQGYYALALNSSLEGIGMETALRRLIGRTPAYQYAALVVLLLH
jgi:hypothetical protein